MKPSEVNIGQLLTGRVFAFNILFHGVEAKHASFCLPNPLVQGDNLLQTILICLNVIALKMGRL